MLKKWLNQMSGNAGEQERQSPDNPGDVYAPLSGRVAALAEVPDPVFAGKMLGDGLAIEPVSGEVRAPFDGEVVSLFPTGHAVGLLARSGLECLIHIGVDTVALGGEGFQAQVRQGDRIKRGQVLIQVDLDRLRQAGKATITPVMVINGSAWRIKDRREGGEVYGGEDVLFSVEPLG